VNDDAFRAIHKECTGVFLLQNRLGASPRVAGELEPRRSFRTIADEISKSEFMVPDPHGRSVVIGKRGPLKWFRLDHATGPILSVRVFFIICDRPSLPSDPSGVYAGRRAGGTELRRR
jgi:hypothetical protein